MVLSALLGNEIKNWKLSLWQPHSAHTKIYDEAWTSSELRLGVLCVCCESEQVKKESEKIKLIANKINCDNLHCCWKMEKSGVYVRWIDARQAGRRRTMLIDFWVGRLKVTAVTVVLKVKSQKAEFTESVFTCQAWVGFCCRLSLTLGWRSRKCTYEKQKINFIHALHTHTHARTEKGHNRDSIRAWIIS